MTAYYNEIEPYCTSWLQNLMDAGEIAPGTIDDRSILDVSPKDLAGYDRCHFFAGIAGWDYALKLAGWPQDQSVWTGSCPCQPFSSAGRGGGGADERHLWPAWFWLIRQCRPPIIFGEQVASKAGLAWLDVVFSDLEAAGYSCGAVDLCAAGLGAPHIRQRLWFVAYAKGIRWSNSGIIGNLGKKKTKKNERRKGRSFTSTIDHNSPTGELADSEGIRSDRQKNYDNQQTGFSQENIWRKSNGMATESERFGLMDNPWQPLHWLPCRDGKYRPTGVVANTESEYRWNISQNNRNGFRWQSGNESDEASSSNSKPRPTQPFIQPLAHGVPARVGRLRAYGNAIVPQVAATFIQAMMEILGD